MLIRNIDGNNDWKFGKGKTDYVKDAYAVGLDIKLRLQEWYQDCFFNLQNGIPWTIRLGEKNQKELLDNDIYEIATSTEGVLSIYNFVSQLDGRRYTCSFEVYQVYSTESLPIKFDSEELWQTN
jgi:hypothetical protein